MGWDDPGQQPPAVDIAGDDEERRRGYWLGEAVEAERQHRLHCDGADLARREDGEARGCRLIGHKAGRYAPKRLPPSPPAPHSAAGSVT